MVSRIKLQKFSQAQATFAGPAAGATACEPFKGAAFLLYRFLHSSGGSSAIPARCQNKKEVNFILWSLLRLSKKKRLKARIESLI
jgi:hypothetical protein